VSFEAPTAREVRAVQAPGIIGRPGPVVNRFTVFAAIPPA
jgi:hypothetical protein